MDNLQISYPTYFLFFIAVIAMLYALSLYINDKRIKENKGWLPPILGILRFTSVLGVLFLLLSPLLRTFITETEKPQIIIAKDISSSVVNSSSKESLDNVNKTLSEFKNIMSERFDIVELDFGENISFSKSDSINIQSTNLSKPLEYISDAYEDQNLGAIVFLTDGIYNEGKNPIYADLQITAPIYSVALGDTTRRTDLLVKNVLHNRIIYLNDKFLIETDIQAYNSAGSKSAVSLYKVENGKQIKLGSQPFSIDKNNYFKSFQFEIDANQVGNVKYVISVNRISNEISSSNNSRNIYVEVLDARQKILLLSDAPHPDIKAIKTIINSNKNYEVDVAYAKDALSSIKNYDLVILHNLPSEKHSITTQLDEINKNKKPVFFIVGGNTDMRKFNNTQNVVNISGGTKSTNNVTPIINKEFSLFTIGNNVSAKIESFVPLKAPFGDYKLGDGTKVLLSQKIGSVETQYPLLAYSDINNHKQTVLCGEGLWRWKLIEYLDTEDNIVSKEIISKTIQYISQKDDKRQYRVFTNKNNYKENEAVLVDAQLYNENYELVNTPEAKLTITNKEGENFDYTLSKTNNYYFIDAGRFPEGNYTFKSSTSFNSKNLKSDGKFSVQSIIKEQYDLTAKHDILHQLSDKFGGEVLYPSEINKLNTLIGDNAAIKPIMYQKAETKPLLDWRWILGGILLLLFIEWFLRRYFGGY